MRDWRQLREQIEPGFYWIRLKEGLGIDGWFVAEWVPDRGHKGAWVYRKDRKLVVDIYWPEELDERRITRAD